MYKFCGSRSGKFINFVDIGGYAICIIGLGGMDAPAMTEHLSDSLTNTPAHSCIEVSIKLYIIDRFVLTCYRHYHCRFQLHGLPSSAYNDL